MNIISLLTVIGLYVAICQVMPFAQRKTVFLKMRKTDWFYVIFLLIIVHVLIYMVEMNKSFPFLQLLNQYITPGIMSYLVLLLGMSYLFISLHFASLPLSKVNNLKAIFEQLILSEDYAALSILVKANIRRLVSIHESQCFPLNLRKRLLDISNEKKSVLVNSQIGDLQILKVKLTISSYINSLISQLQSLFIILLLRFLSRYESVINDTQELFHFALSNEIFIKAIIKTDLLIVKELLPLNSRFMDSFIKIYCQQLLGDRSSRLYFEVKDLLNHDFTRTKNYDFVDYKVLFLIGDPKLADKYVLWMPLGEYVLNYLDNQYLVTEGKYDLYNLPEEHIPSDYEDWKLSSPIYIVIQLFELMLSRAIWSNMSNHMWIYYFQYITEKICRNFYPILDYVDLTEEFPTKYSRLMYEIIESCLRIISILPLGCGAQGVKVIRHHVLPVLCKCLKKILLTVQISREYKMMLVDRVLQTYFLLIKNTELSDVADTFYMLLISGGKQEKIEKIYLKQLFWGVLERDNLHEFKEACLLVQQIFNTYIKEFGAKSLMNDGIMITPVKGSTRFYMISSSKNIGQNYKITIKEDIQVLALESLRQS